MVILEQTHLVKNKTVDNKKSMKYSIFQQALTIAVILLISKIIESFMPIPMPASVIGLVLLFIALCTGIVKLGQVETVGTALTNNIDSYSYQLVFQSLTLYQSLSKALF